MNKDQKQIATSLVANVLRSACVRISNDKRPLPTADELKLLAENAGAAIAAGIAKINAG